MGLLFIILFILSLLSVSKIFSFLKNQELSNHKSKPYKTKITQVVKNQINPKPVDIPAINTWLKASNIDNFENQARRKFEKEVANFFKEK